LEMSILLFVLSLLYFFKITPNARRLCEVFCISQNLQMYEVPERASDGKASGRCSGSPKGFRYIVLRLGVVADFNHKCSNEEHTSNIAQMFIRSTSPAITPNRCYRLAFLSYVV